jgi:uncharacterized protein with von Willebrand factor type A (vWA) domain
MHPDQPRRNSAPLGGVIHTYQKYDPAQFPSPTAEPPDFVSPAMEHLLQFGNLREFTAEELANAIHLDASQIAGLGPSLDALMEMLRERKRKILETYEVGSVKKEAAAAFREQARQMKPPAKLARPFERAVREEQLHDLEQLWYSAGDERSPFAVDLLRLTERLGDKYQVDELAGKYEFTGDRSLTVPEAIEVKRELEEIDRLLKQLEEAARTAQLAIIDMESLEQFIPTEDVQNLSALQQQVQDFLREQAERQGLEQSGRGGFRLTPQAYRLFQGKLLSQIFSQLLASKTGRHPDAIVGEGAVELPRTRPYEFGDSVAHMDIPASMVNAMLRTAGAGGPVSLPVRMKPDDIEVHHTRNNPKCATVVLLDMSGSMRYGGQYMNVKRMGLALDGLIRKEYPGDFLQFIEVYSLAKPRHLSEIPALMPKPVTVYDPVVRLRADLSDPDLSESRIPPHFTNIQHGLRLARQFLAGQDTPNRQVVLITDGLPTAHLDGSFLYLLYPPDPRTEEATLREGLLCAREGITINLFLLSSWNQSEEDVRFAYRLCESTKGRVFFVAGRDLDRYVVWDYITRRKQILS